MAIGHRIRVTLDPSFLRRVLPKPSLRERIAGFFPKQDLHRLAKPGILQISREVAIRDWFMRPQQETTHLAQLLTTYGVREILIPKGTPKTQVDYAFRNNLELFHYALDRLRQTAEYGTAYNFAVGSFVFSRGPENLALKIAESNAIEPQKAASQKTLTLAEELAAAILELKEEEEHYARLKDEHDKVLAPLNRLNSIERELTDTRIEQKGLLKQIGNLGTRIKSLQERLDSLDNKKTDEAYNLLKKLHALKDLRKNKREKAENMEKEAQEIEGRIKEYEFSLDTKAKLFFEFSPWSDANLRSTEHTIKSLQDRINKLTGSHDYKATPTTALDSEQVEEIMKYFRT